jgi:hypothetical protein
MVGSGVEPGLIFGARGVWRRIWTDAFNAHVDNTV